MKDTFNKAADKAMGDRKKRIRDFKKREKQEKESAWNEGDRLLKKHGAPDDCWHKRGYKETRRSAKEGIVEEIYCHRCGKVWFYSDEQQIADVVSSIMG